MKSLENIVSKTVSKAKNGLKRALFVGGLLGALAFGGVREAKADSHENYFPLYVGNSWTYVNTKTAEELTFTITGTQEIDGNTYYKFDDFFAMFFPPPPGGIWRITMGLIKTLYRYDSLTDKFIMYEDYDGYGYSDYPFIRYDFSGNAWNPGGGYEPARLKQTGVTCNVPAGEFSNCINFQFGGPMYLGPGIVEPDAYYTGEYLAQDVGIVKYVQPGGNYLWVTEGSEVTFELKDYTIIPEPCTLVLLGIGSVCLLSNRKRNFK